MKPRGNTLKLTAVAALVVLTLTGFSTGRGHGGSGDGGGGGGCSSSGQNHDSSSGSGGRLVPGRRPRPRLRRGKQQFRRKWQRQRRKLFLVPAGCHRGTAELRLEEGPVRHRRGHQPPHRRRRLHRHRGLRERGRSGGGLPLAGRGRPRQRHGDRAGERRRPQARPPASPAATRIHWPRPPAEAGAPVVGEQICAGRGVRTGRGDCPSDANGWRQGPTGNPRGHTSAAAAPPPRRRGRSPCGKDGYLPPSRSRAGGAGMWLSRVVIPSPFGGAGMWLS